jgi:hypothetical protein
MAGFARLFWKMVLGLSAVSPLDVVGFVGLAARNIE